MLDGKRYALGQIEWRLLRLLLLARGAWLNREALMDAIYEGNPSPPFDTAICGMIHQIRKKFDGARLSIETRRMCAVAWRARIGVPANGKT